MILEEQFPVPRNNSVSKIGNSVISLLWQLRCHCNPDHNKFSSLSNTTVVAIFPKLCLWRRSLCSNLGGTGLEKLYRATLSRTHVKVFFSLWFIDFVLRSRRVIFSWAFKSSEPCSWVWQACYTHHSSAQTGNLSSLSQNSFFVWWPGELRWCRVRIS